MNRFSPFTRRLLIVIPFCMLCGASMELFMNVTGFYSIVKRKQAERLIEKEIEQCEYLKQQKIRNQLRNHEQNSN